MSRLRRAICVVAFASLAVRCSASEKIVFVRMAPIQARLFISNADGSSEQSITQPGSLDYNPSWSPKGDWIVFTSERGGSADLYRIHPDGSGLDQLTDDPAYDDQATFSPDGAQIVFVSTRTAGTANLWILDVATHKARSVTSGHGGDFRPAWSPDGQWIAFSSDRNSSLRPSKTRFERLHQFDLYLVRPDGSGLKSLAQPGRNCGSPKWTHDSKSIIAYCMSAEQQDFVNFSNARFASGVVETQLFQLDVASGDVKPVTAGLGMKLFPAVLESGEFAYLRRDDPKGVFYADGGKHGPLGDDVRSPSWSPDGKRIVFSRYQMDNSDDPRKLWSRNSKYELFTAGFLSSYDHAGERLALTHFNSDDTSSLIIIDEGKPGRSILNRKEVLVGPKWSPDGKQLAFGIGLFNLLGGWLKPGDYVPGENQVAVVNADGSGFHVITSGDNNNAFPSFAPDGKRIVYRTKGSEGDGLRILNLQDHSITVLTTDYDNFPAWSPRGDLIVFIRKIGVDFEVFTIRPDGSNARQLTRTKGNDSHAAWSPDGERIVFTSSRNGFKDEVFYTDAPQPYGEIFVMKSDGTEVEQLTDNQWEDGGPTWQPHNKNPLPTPTPK